MKNIIISDLSSALDRAHGLDPSIIGGSLAKVVLATGAKRNHLDSNKYDLAIILDDISRTSTTFSPDYSSVVKNIHLWACRLADSTKAYDSDSMNGALWDVINNILPVRSRADHDNNLHYLGGALAKIIAANGTRKDILLSDADGLRPLDYAVCALDCACNIGNYSGAINDLANLDRAIGRVK